MSVSRDPHEESESDLTRPSSDGLERRSDGALWLPAMAAGSQWQKLAVPLFERDRVVCFWLLMRQPDLLMAGAVMLAAARAAVFTTVAAAVLAAASTATGAAVLAAAVKRIPEHYLTPPLSCDFYLRQMYIRIWGSSRHPRNQ